MYTAPLCGVKFVPLTFYFFIPIQLNLSTVMPCNADLCDLRLALCTSTAAAGDTVAPSQAAERPLSLVHGSRSGQQALGKLRSEPQTGRKVSNWSTRRLIWAGGRRSPSLLHRNLSVGGFRTLSPELCLPLAGLTCDM